MQFGEAISKLVKLVIWASVIYYIFIDDPTLEKNTEFDVKDAHLVPSDVTTVHTANGKLGELGYTLLPQREFNRELIYPVMLGIDFFKNFKLKEFEYYGFQDGNVYAKVIVRFALKFSTFRRKFIF